jgi:catechol 2,3-dioxygenase-like lactoylglutathione lyase family enzyme
MTQALLDRDGELRALAGLVEEAAAGEARLVVVEGAAGIGKTRLAAEARRRAESAGMRALSARGSELERAFAFGVVRQLFEPPGCSTSLSRVSALHHVALEIRREDLEACRAFYALVGFEEVALPDERLEPQGRFLQGGPTQIHLLFADDAVVAPKGHAALVVDDYEGALQRLRDAGFEPEDRTRYWGSPRAKLNDPAGHVVELMEYPPS